ncbi:MAG: hypothetical protein ACLPKI_13910 [Streptosporangiaceae bacterium]
MAARWIRVYRGYGSGVHRSRVSVAVPVGAGAGGLGTGSATRIASPPERHFPVPVVILRGVFALATIVLLRLTALGHGT